MYCQGCQGSGFKCCLHLKFLVAKFLRANYEITKPRLRSEMNILVVGIGPNGSKLILGTL